jgi:UPF0716 protein FxsA
MKGKKIPYSLPGTERKTPMLLRLFILFTLVPVAELYLLIKIGSYLGAVNTVAVVIITAFIGAYLARLEGVRTVMKVRDSLSQGVMPTDELVDALMIFGASVVLLTPGFITDILGFLILIPATRKSIRTWLKHRLKEWMIHH